MNAGLDFTSGSAKALNFGPNFQSSSQKFGSNFGSGPNFGITRYNELNSDNAERRNEKHDKMVVDEGHRCNTP